MSSIAVLAIGGDLSIGIKPERTGQTSAMAEVQVSMFARVILSAGQSKSLTGILYFCPTEWPKRASPNVRGLDSLTFWRGYMWSRECFKMFAKTVVGNRDSWQNLA